MAITLSLRDFGSAALAEREIRRVADIARRNDFTALNAAKESMRELARCDVGRDLASAFSEVRRAQEELERMAQESCSIRIGNDYLEELRSSALAPPLSAMDACGASSLSQAADRYQQSFEKKMREVDDAIHRPSMSLGDGDLSSMIGDVVEKMSIRNAWHSAIDDIQARLPRLASALPDFASVLPQRDFDLGISKLHGQMTDHIQHQREQIEALLIGTRLPDPLEAFTKSLTDAFGHVTRVEDLQGLIGGARFSDPTLEWVIKHDVWVRSLHTPDHEDANGETEAATVEPIVLDETGWLEVVAMSNVVALFAPIQQRLTALAQEISADAFANHRSCGDNVWLIASEHEEFAHDLCRAWREFQGIRTRICAQRGPSKEGRFESISTDDIEELEEAAAALLSLLDRIGQRGR